MTVSRFRPPLSSTVARCAHGKYPERRIWRCVEAEFLAVARTRDMQQRQSPHMCMRSTALIGQTPSTKSNLAMLVPLVACRYTQETPDASSRLLLAICGLLLAGCALRHTDLPALPMAPIPQATLTPLANSGAPTLRCVR